MSENPKKLFNLGDKVFAFHNRMIPVICNTCNVAKTQLEWFVFEGTISRRYIDEDVSNFHVKYQLHDTSGNLVSSESTFFTNKNVFSTQDDAQAALNIHREKFEV